MPYAVLKIIHRCFWKYAAWPFTPKDYNERRNERYCVRAEYKRYVCFNIAVKGQVNRRRLLQQNKMHW